MEQGLRHRASFRIDAAHPSLAGHFPGRPLVPGVVVLDSVVRAAEERLGRPLAIVGLPRVKFTAPLRPAEQADCDLELTEARLAFRVRRDGQPIAEGVFALAGGSFAPAESAR